MAINKCDLKNCIFNSAWENDFLLSRHTFSLVICVSEKTSRNKQLALLFLKVSQPRKFILAVAYKNTAIPNPL